MNKNILTEIEQHRTGVLTIDIVCGIKHNKEVVTL